MASLLAAEVFVREILLALLVVCSAPSVASAQTCYQRPLSSRITQYYGPSHQGVDFAAAVNTPIPSIADGVVVLVIGPGNAQEGYCHGRVVVVRHPDGKNSAYAHLNSIQVSVGQSVSRGQVIAHSGQTGSCARGPHLHLGLSPASDVYGYRDHNNQDPLPYIDSHRACRPDADGDGSLQGDDCDDHDANRTPGRHETCDDVDNDCDDRVDESLTRTCGMDEGACQPGNQTCASGAWGTCVGEVAPQQESCDALDDDCDGAVDEARTCEHDDARTAAALFSRTSSDVNGDGRADGCVRTPAGFSCLTSASFGFEHVIFGPAMSDDEGWDASSFYGSVRMGDVDGDGRDDLCTRDGDRMVCFRATGVDFGQSLASLPLGRPSPGAESAEVWLADVDGDARVDLCARDVLGLRCAPSAGGAVWEFAAVSDEEGFDDVARHGSIRFGDIDGDGRDDVCARRMDGIACWLATEDGWGATPIAGPAWTDANGWLEPRLGSTIRLADVDGDGRAEVCGRGPVGFQCWPVSATARTVPYAALAMSTEDGWDDRSVYATIRMGDIDGDGASDLCARLASGVRCWLSNRRGFDRVVAGPALSDADGWNAAARYGSLRLADVSGDGRADLCARGGEGLRCWISDGEGFTREWRSAVWSDALGLSDPSFAATLTVGGGNAITTPEAGLAGGCACRAYAGGRSSGGWSALALLALVGWRRSRASRLRAS